MPKAVYNQWKNSCNSMGKTCGLFYTALKNIHQFIKKSWKKPSFSHFNLSFPETFTQIFYPCFLTNKSTVYTEPITTITNILNK